MMLYPWSLILFLVRLTMTLNNGLAKAPIDLAS
jgi:hypothetical protein